MYIHTCIDVTATCVISGYKLYDSSYGVNGFAKQLCEHVHVLCVCARAHTCACMHAYMHIYIYIQISKFKRLLGCTGIATSYVCC